MPNVKRQNVGSRTIEVDTAYTNYDEVKWEKKHTKAYTALRIADIFVHQF